MTEISLFSIWPDLFGLYIFVPILKDTFIKPLSLIVFKAGLRAALFVCVLSVFVVRDICICTC